MKLEWPFGKKETRFGLKIGQSKSGLSIVQTWAVISQSARSIDFLGYGELTVADIKRISEEIGEDEMFVYGSFGKKKKKVPVLALLLEVDLKEIEGIIVKGKRYQVTEKHGETAYRIDDNQLTEYYRGKRKLEDVEYVNMIDIKICDAYRMLMEFIKL